VSSRRRRDLGVPYDIGHLSGTLQGIVATDLGDQEYSMTQPKRTYWIYIMTNRSGTLYTDLTGNLARRVSEHRNHSIPGFASRYRTDRLILAEPFAEVQDAIAREKQIKAWRRSHKLNLIAESNPKWHNLGEELLGPASDT
jgi:putative endonuclease